LLRLPVIVAVLQSRLILLCAQLTELRKAEKTLIGGKKVGGNSKSVTVSVHVTSPEPITLQLVYIVSGQASWKPSYGVCRLLLYSALHGPVMTLRVFPACAQICV
jgi:hypothetical protein